jgi:uncharacterized protein
MPPRVLRRIAVALWLTAACLAGCREAPAPPGVDAARPALWVVEGPDRAPKGWLFGTIHALPRDVAWETPALARAIEAAGVLVVEVRDLDPRLAATTIRRVATDEPVPPLAERLPRPIRARLADALADGAPASLDRLETWAVALAVAREAQGPAEGPGADQALIARFAGRPIAELEGLEPQLALFDRLSERDQRALLLAVLKEREGGDERQALTQAWLAGDLARLERSTRRGLLADPALYEALLANRNQAWLGPIVALLEQNRKPLVAVGAGHMLGPDGLPALLAARGYRVRRVQ